MPKRTPVPRNQGASWHLRFITEDPARAGSNWYAYVNNNPLRYTDPTGLWVNFAIGAGIGFIASSASEIGSRMATGQDFWGAMSSTYSDPVSRAAIGASTAIGALTSGTSAIAAGIATKGPTAVGSIAARNIAVNIVGGSVDAAVKDVANKAIHGNEQNAVDTLTKAAVGGVVSGSFSVVSQGAVALGTTKVSTIKNVRFDIDEGVHLIEPKSATAVTVGLENGPSTAIDVYSSLTQERIAPTQTLSEINRIEKPPTLAELNRL